MDDQVKTRLSRSVKARKKFTLPIATVIAALIGVTPITISHGVSAAGSKPRPQPSQADPRTIVTDYYNDITHSNYYDAWKLLSLSIQARQRSYSLFVKGYKSTGAQLVTECRESGDQVHFYLESENPDGTIQYYEGTATAFDGLIQYRYIIQLAGNPNA